MEALRDVGAFELLFELEGLELATLCYGRKAVRALWRIVLGGVLLGHAGLQARPVHIPTLAHKIFCVLYQMMKRIM